jgi:hypothetical protein
MMTVGGGYENWALDRPNNLNGNEHCAELNMDDLNAQWNDIQCGLSRGFICEASAN